MINYIVVFLAGALLGARSKWSIVAVAVVCAAMNIIMLWSTFNIVPALQQWQIWANSLPIIGSWIAGLIGLPVAIFDIFGAGWAAIYGTAAGGIGWAVGRFWLKKQRWI